MTHSVSHIGTPTLTQRRIDYQNKLRFDCINPQRKMRRKLIEQLDRCTDDACRRILLGVSEQAAA